MGNTVSKYIQSLLFNTSAQCSDSALSKLDAVKLRRVVELEYQKLPCGATADEIVERLQKQGMRVDAFAVRPRVTELKREGLLYLTQERRKNNKGNTCAVLYHINFLH